MEKLAMAKVTCDELLVWQRQQEFTLLDVRLQAVKDAQPLSIAGAQWRDPEQDSWMSSLDRSRPIVVFCAHGRSISQGIAARLAEAGFMASYLAGGLAAWQEQGHLVVSD
jgi:thiosulfate sulfurtransferase